jgi:hypothetical protein
MGKQTTTSVPLDFQITGLLGLVDRYRELAASTDDPAQRAAWLRVADKVMARVRELSGQTATSRRPAP